MAQEGQSQHSAQVALARPGNKAERTGAHRRRRRRNPRSVIYLLLALIVFMSPVVLTHLQNIEQQRVAEEYSRAVREMSEDQRHAELDQAKEYNTRLPEVGSPDPWVNGVDVNSPAYQEYKSILGTLLPMARLRVGSVGIDLPVYHGTSKSVLSHGVGHLYGTALPVGGEGTHAVLTGHTGLATLTMFDNLTHVENDDVIVVEVMGETLAYKVYDIEVVLPEEIQSIKPQEGRDLLTLVTCTPYGINSHRLLVHAERTEVPEHVEQNYQSPWQLWMTIATVIGAFIVLYLLWWLRSQRKRAKALLQSSEANDHQINTQV